MSPGEPLGVVARCKAGLGNPLVPKDLEEATEPQGIHRGGSVGVMLGRHGEWWVSGEERREPEGVLLDWRGNSGPGEDKTWRGAEGGVSFPPPPPSEY